MVFRNIKKHLRLRGEVKVPVHLACRICRYKYALVNQKNEATYEELVEFRSHGTGIMDRCLIIGKQYAEENSKLGE
jgi:hypothetical protein